MSSTLAGVGCFRRVRWFVDWRLASVALASWLLLAGAADAHDTWILPIQPTVAAGRAVVLDLTSGMAFPSNESPVQPDRLVRASWRVAGKRSELATGSAGKRALSLRMTPGEPGIAAIWVESKPRSVDLTPAQVREYLKEIGAWESVGRQWEKEGSGKWRETYAKHAKTFVRVGTPQGEESWKEPVGMDFEIVPERDPTGVAPGEELPVRLLKAGRPLPDFPVGLVAAGQKAGSLRKTDGEGRASLRLDRKGWWLIRATSVERSASGKEDWESHFTTLTVFVSPR